MQDIKLGQLPLHSTQRAAAQVPFRPLQGSNVQGQEKEKTSTYTNVEEAMAELNNKLELAQRSFRFRIDEQTDRIIVSVIDENTGKVIRQIPSEEVVKLDFITEELRGLLFNEEV